MNAVIGYVQRFMREEDAVTIVEMVIIVAVILIVVLPTLQNLGSAENERLEEMESKLRK
ncbi:pilus assembly protein [Brevibacillus fluminis]|uniref:Pilus assembly protein n=1 Tax=Brevibacillus fluminis TaxID=511487 RepID=A0A3M8D4I0_9BACL|nr:pilus assembly protein [Brevibacillus fluminis]RNB82798.1 pilus assembly protein [Brevibacillus fluminis]